MGTLINLLIIAIAIQHIAFMLLEMLWWKRPLGRRLFATSREFAEASYALAANQGLYNGFLAAGLIWAAFSDRLSVSLFFLSCVFIAGVFGGLTVSRLIFWVQALPAMLTLVLLFMNLA